MGRQDPGLTVYDPSDADVWDRVGALAPSSAPVRGKLFKASNKRSGSAAAPPMAVPLRDIFSQHQDAMPLTVNAEPDLVEQAPKGRRATARPKALTGRPQINDFTRVEPQNTASDVGLNLFRSRDHLLIPEALEMPLATVPEHDGTEAIERNWARLRPAVVEAVDPLQSLQTSVARLSENEVSQSFDLLRMRLLQTLKDNGWRRVAITSPTPGCGSTFVACNLAVSLSRIREQRTVLMDLNLRAPGVAKAFALRTETNIAGFLAGEVSTSQSIQRYQGNVALAAGRSCATATAEMLYDTKTIAALKRLEHELCPDVMLFDLPPMLAYDDVSAFLPQVDGVLLISNGTKTMGKEIAACERAIAGRTKLLGVLMNEARKSDCKVAGYRNA